MPTTRRSRWPWALSYRASCRCTTFARNLHFIAPICKLQSRPLRVDALKVNFADGSHGLAPADFNVIYNVGSGMTGAGVTIAVVANTDINVAQDIREFRTLFGLPTNDPQIVLNGPDPGDIGGDAESEAVLDVTWSGSVAPNATIKLVVSEDTNAVDGVDLSEFILWTTTSRIS